MAALATVTGVQGSTRIRPNGETSLGHYVLGVFISPQAIPTEVECPYCHRYMDTDPGCFGRIVWQGEPVSATTQAVIIDPLPPTLRMLHCRPCKSTFTVPVEG